MNIKKINDTDYLIIVFKSFSCEDKINLYIKQLLSRYRIMLRLSGFYKVKVYNRCFGLYIKIIQIEDSYYKDTFDYRIVFDNNSNFYFKTSDYFVVKDCQYVYYFEGDYYALVDDSFDEILEKVEFGLFELESDIDFRGKEVLVR